MSRLVNDSMFVLLAEILGAVGTLLNGILIARATGDAGKGVYTLVISAAAMGALLFGLRWDRGVGHFLARDEKRLGAILGSILLMAGVASALGIAVWLLLPGLLERYVLRDLGRPAILLAVLILPVTFLWQGLLAVYGGLRDFRGRATYVGLLAAVQVAPASLLFAAGIRDAWWYLVAYLASILGLVLVQGGLLVHRHGVRPTFDGRLIGQMARYNSLVYVAVLLDALAVRLDVFLINALLDPPIATAQVGVYSVAVGLATQLMRVPNLCGHVVFHRMSANEMGQGEATARLVRVSLLVMIPAGVLMALLGEWLIVRLYSDAFIGATTALYLMIPAVMFLGILRLLAADLDGRGLPGRIGVCTALTAVAVTILDFWWIPIWGIEGAALASLAAYALGCLAASVLFSHVSGIAWADLFVPRKQDAVQLASALASVAGKLGARLGIRLV